jgi:hypothetical protein
MARSGQAIRDTMIAGISALVVAITEERRPFEDRLRAHWGPAIDGLEALINAAMEAGELYVHDQREAKSWTATDESLVRIHSRSCLVAGEVLALLRAGFPSGANARWRTLHELAVTAFFIKENGDDLAERYLAHRAVARKREFDAFATHAEALGERPPTVLERRRIDDPVSVLKARFGTSYGNRYGWAASTLGVADPTFDKIEDAVDMGSTRFLWKQASESVHSGPRSFYDDLGATASRGTMLLAGASNTGLGGPGRRTTSSLAQVTIALLNRHVTAERILIARSVIEFSAHVGDAFDSCAAESDAATARNWGRIARRAALARRKVGPARSFVDLKQSIESRRRRRNRS